MKDKLKNVFLILLVVAFMSFLLISSILDLTNKKDFHTVHADGALEILSVEHAINGLIPVGTDHYYFVLDEKTLDAYLVKAPKNWLKKNFKENGRSENVNGVEISGLAKKVSDFQTSRELASRAVSIEDVTYPMGVECCLDLTYKEKAIKKLVLFFLSLFIMAFLVWLVKHKGQVDIKPVYMKLLLVVAIVWLYFLLTVLR